MSYTSRHVLVAVTVQAAVAALVYLLLLVGVPAELASLVAGAASAIALYAAHEEAQWRLRRDQDWPRDYVRTARGTEPVYWDGPGLYWPVGAVLVICLIAALYVAWRSTNT